jgi:hypothetical protein
MNSLDNEKLLWAFPWAIRADVEKCLGQLPENPHHTGTFSVHVGQEQLAIPNRVFHDARLVVRFELSDLQKCVVDCILTRHNDGHVRQKHLEKIIRSDAIWVAPYVIRLAGEYVIEILQDIEKNLPTLNRELYGSFLRENPEFLSLISQQVSSYWDCYYRSYRKEDYPGFRVLHAFREMAK